MSTSRRTLRVFLGALPLLAALCGCSVPRAAGAGRGEALLVRLNDYRAGTRYELASESHTSPVEYYSDERSDAVRKVQTDEVMSVFSAELARQGFGAHAQTGPAPAVASGGVIRWGLEVERPAGCEHWLVGPGSSAADWRAFQECQQLFLDLYNLTVSYQTVENQSGEAFFGEEPRDPGKRLR
jgi:hypothetical protein